MGTPTNAPTTVAVRSVPASVNASATAKETSLPVRENKNPINDHNAWKGHNNIFKSIHLFFSQNNARTLRYRISRIKF